MNILLAIFLWVAPLVHRAPGPVRYHKPMPRLPVKVFARSPERVGGLDVKAFPVVG
jgi:hypothetical protein